MTAATAAISPTSGRHRADPNANARGGREAFLQDVDVQDAVLWRLQTLAEATGRLSQAVKDRHPEIRWRAVYGFRNIAAHAYLDLRLDQVWEIIELHLPALKAVVDDELGRSAPP